MTVEEVIKKAIEGGWRDEYAFDNLGRILKNEEFDRIFLDPSFWQSLGKALGWKDTYVGQPKFVAGAMYGQSLTANEVWPEWLYHWHRFIDHLTEGKTPESFFQGLTQS